jgi:transposase-like protein
MGIKNELKNRGAKDILLVAVDGLTGFPDAIAAVFPGTEVQLCMVCRSLGQETPDDCKILAQPVE